MRDRNECPVCEGHAGRVETQVSDGETALIYWHTDLEHTKEFCIEHPDGRMKQVCQGQGQPTGPRRA